MPSTIEKPTAISILVATAFFMENLDGTVIATALPDMGKSFHANPVDLNIGMTAYMLMLAVFIPISGWVADRVGARTVFVSAIAVFTASSILCGLSTGIVTFTGARVIQGIGGAMMVPVGRLVVLRTTEKHNLIDAITFITWPALIAPVVGPPVGGFITTYASWHWIFFLNVPIGIVGMALSARIIPNLKGAEVKPFDWIGFVLSALACVSFVYGMELVGRESARWQPTVAYLIAGCVLGVLSVLYFLRARAPLLNLGLLKIKTFGISLQGGSLFRLAISVSPFLLPLMFQVGFGLNAFQSGLLMLGLFTGNLLMKSVVTPILRRFGFRNVLTTNGILHAILMASCALLYPRTATVIVLFVLFLNGLSRSMQFTAVGTLAFADIAKPDMSSATSFFSMITQMSMGMGVAVGAIALRIAGFLTGNSMGAPTTKEFHVAFLLVAVLCIVATLDCFILDPDAGAAVSGHRLGPVPEKTTAPT
jgi:EmrB/QacA subfamily drug resistance transporter